LPFDAVPRCWSISTPVNPRGPDDTMKRLGWEIGLTIALICLLAWLALGERLSSWWMDGSEISVRVVRVRKHSIPGTLLVSGVLAPVSEIQVVSQLAGRVGEMHVKSGDSVRAGAPIATIYASEVAARRVDLEAALASARKDLSGKESRLAAAERLATQRRELFQQDLIARRDLEQAESALGTARAEAELARAHLAQQEAMLAQARAIQSLNQITAPSAGVISRRWVEPGASIGAASPLVSIAKGNLVKFTGRVSGTQAAALREGLSAMVRAGESVDGIVSRVVTSGAGQSVAAEIEIQIRAAAAKFRFGMAAEAVVNLEQIKESLQVPRSALVESGGEWFVYKIAAGRAVRQAVRLGSQDGDEVEVESGISAADSVIAGNLHAIKPESRVRAVEQSPPQRQ
jgi:RND family efflux transporter MFP subunit